MCLVKFKHGKFWIVSGRNAFIAKAAIDFKNTKLDDKDESNSADDSKRDFFCDLDEKFGMQATIKEVLIDKILVSYTYRKVKFELELAYKIEIVLTEEYDKIDRKVGDYKKNGKNSANKKPTDVKKSDDFDRGTFDRGSGHIPIKDMDYLKNNYNKILNELQTRSYYNRETGKYEGVILQNVPEKSLARKYGFVRNDIIISINGHPVTNKGAAVRWAKANPNESSYNVIYLRKGQQKTFRYVPKKK